VSLHYSIHACNVMYLLHSLSSTAYLPRRPSRSPASQWRVQRRCSATPRPLFRSVTL
jgi:hypothetical protein